MRKLFEVYLETSKLRVCVNSLGPNIIIIIFIIIIFREHFRALSILCEWCIDAAIYPRAHWWYFSWCDCFSIPSYIGLEICCDYFHSDFRTVYYFPTLQVGEENRDFEQFMALNSDMKNRWMELRTVDLSWLEF